MVSFSTNGNDSDIIGNIVKRFAEMMADYDGKKINIMACRMDVTAVHCNGCSLDLAGLLAADDFNFLHDVGGIQRNINRNTGQLERCFRPRFAI